MKRHSSKPDDEAYTCFKDPANGRLYKVRVSPPTESLSNGEAVVDRASGTAEGKRRKEYMSDGVFEAAKRAATAVHLENIYSSKRVSEEIEIIIVNCQQSLYPHEPTSQTNTFIELETTALRIDTSRRELVCNTGKPLILMYAYGELAVFKTKQLLDRVSCAYDESPEIKSYEELIDYLENLSSRLEITGRRTI